MSGRKCLLCRTPAAAGSNLCEGCRDRRPMSENRAAPSRTAAGKPAPKARPEAAPATERIDPRAAAVLASVGGPVEPMVAGPMRRVEGRDAEGEPTSRRVPLALLAV